MPEHPTPLRDMIKEAAKNAAGYRRLAERAVDPRTGTRAASSYLNKLANGKIQTIPGEGHLGAIAAALDVPFEIAWLAAVVQFMPGDGPLTAMLDRELAAQAKAYEDERAAETEGADVIANALRVIAAAHREVADQRHHPKAA